MQAETSCASRHSNDMYLLVLGSLGTQGLELALQGGLLCGCSALVLQQPPVLGLQRPQLLPAGQSR